MEFKKGDKVILKGFTGIKLGVFEIAKVDKKSVTIIKKNGDELIFSLKTGKQTNVAEGKERFANSIMEDDGSYVDPQKSKKTVEKKSAKKVSKRAKVEEPEDDEDEDEEEPQPAPKKTKKAAKPAKKSKKVVEEDEDEDDYEEVDD